MIATHKESLKDIKIITIEELLQLDQHTITLGDVLQMHILEALYCE